MASFPPPASPSVDWSSIGFQVREVNGHVESTYRPSVDDRASWSEPRFVTSPYLSIHGMAAGLNYGVQSFEGIKAFRQPDGNITIFRPDRNAVRMQRSNQYLAIPEIPEDLFVQCCELAVAANAEFVPPHETSAAMYIRPLAFASGAQLPLQASSEYTFVVFVMPTGVYHGVHALDALIMEEFDRTAPEGTGSAKIGGNYAPVLRHSDKARQEGYGITLHLDSKTRTEIDEFSTSGFIGVLKDGDKVTIVQPSSKNVIESVTASSVLQIATDVYNYPVERRRVEYAELANFKEVFACGTAASLVPIKSITHKSNNEKFDYPIPGDGGPIFTDFIKTLKGIQLGNIKDQFGWNHKVTAPPAGFVDQAQGANGPKAVDQIP